MASLAFIMDVDDDPKEAPSPPRSVKKGKDPAVSSAPGSRGQDPPSTSRPTQQPSSSGHPREKHPSPTASGSGSGSTSTGKRQRASANHPSRSPAPAPSSSSTRPAGRRRSTTSTDSMDQGGYASSSSMGGNSGALGPPNHPIRPMPPNTSGSELPVKLTPITGRVSRAKKGVPVHICEICRPPKVSGPPIRPDRGAGSAPADQNRPSRERSTCGKKFSSARRSR